MEKNKIINKSHRVKNGISFSPSIDFLIFINFGL